VTPQLAEDRSGRGCGAVSSQRHPARAARLAPSNAHSARRPRPCRPLGSISAVWLRILELVLAVLNAWANLRALLVRLIKIPFLLARGIIRIIRCPDPLSIQLADVVDNLGYNIGFLLSRDPETSPRLFVASTVPLTTWLRRPAGGLDSYRRHLRALRKYEL